MIILDQTFKSITVVLGGTVTTNELDIAASYVDIETSTFGLNGVSNQNTSTNGTTAVTAVLSPASGVSRQVKHISIYNADTAAATVTVALLEASTSRELISLTLTSGDTLEYTDGRGWHIVEAASDHGDLGGLTDDDHPQYRHSTGVVTGGDLTIATSTTFDISDGYGYIVDESIDPPTVTRVSWTGKSGITATQIASGIISYISLDSDGNVVQRAQGDRWTGAERRNEITLGVLVHVDKVSLNTVNIEAQTYRNVASQIVDIFDVLGILNTSGNSFSANGANLNIDKTSGQLAYHGANWANDKDDPNFITIGASTAGVFQYRLQNGTNHTGLAQTAILPDILDDGTSTPASVTSNKWTVQRIFIFLSGAVKLQPGQAEYVNLADAVAGISTDDFTIEPSIADNGCLRAFLAVKQGATDLSDPAQARFISVSKFGAPASSGATADHGALVGLGDDDHTQYSIITSGAGASASTPARVGAIYVDTTADRAYLATDAASSADWDIVVTPSSTDTLTNKTITSPDIDGGTIDGATIGGTTPGAGTFTAVTVDNITIDGDVINYGSGDVLQTFTANTLAWTGATDYSFDGKLGVGVSPVATYALSVNGVSDPLASFTYSSYDGIIYNDIQNTNNGASAAATYRIITRDIAGTGTSAANLIRYGASGEFHITNGDGGPIVFDIGSEIARLTSAGLAVTGNLSLPDSQYLYLGTGNDLSLRHDGADSAIKNQTGTLFIDAGNITFRSFAADEVLASFVDDGAVTLYYDNSVKLATTTSGVSVTGGVTFDAGSNYLDTYEEGTFTPVYSDGTNNASTYTAQIGAYTRIGDTVFFQIYLTPSNIGSVSGDIRITGLPYTSAASSVGFGTVDVGYSVSLSITAGYSLTGYVEASSTYLRMYLWDVAGGVTALTHTEWPVNGLMVLRGSYKVA